MTNTSNTQKRAPAPVFVAMTVVIFVFSLSAADSIGFVPYFIDGSEPSHERVALSSLPELGPELRGEGQGMGDEETAVVTALPERIVIPQVSIDLPVQNPNTRDIEVLDTLLQDGPVRYVDSAQLGEKGNVLIFAHTSHRPVVHNQMFKAFNRIPELEAGDTITIEGNGKSYLYTVTSVRQANAEEAVIDISPSVGRKLTLVTCDTLTGKDARYILEADFVAVI